MKKKLLAVLMSTVMVLGLAACGSTPEEAGQSSVAESVEQDAAQGEEEEQITLRMAWWGSQTRHDITTQVIEMYEKEHPNIDIEYEFYSFDDYFTKLKTLVASDQVWDIFQLGGNFPMYMDKIYFLNEFIDSGVVDVSEIPEA